MRRRSGLNFSRRRKKFNVPLFKEILSWVIECAVVVLIAYTLVTFFGMRTSVVGTAMKDTLDNEEQILVNRLYIVFRARSRGILWYSCRTVIRSLIIMCAV